MSVQPVTLPSVDSTSTWAGTYVYKWRASGTGTEIYGLWGGSSFDNPNHDIQVNTSTNTWQDAASGAWSPDTLTESNGVITVSNVSQPGGANSNLYKFNKPTSASWLGPTVSFARDTTNGRTLNATISGVAQSTTYYLTDSTNSGPYDTISIGPPNTSGTLSWTAPTDVYGPSQRIYRVVEGNFPSGTYNTVGSGWTVGSLAGSDGRELNPSWGTTGSTTNQWTYSNGTLSANFSSLVNVIAGDIFSIRNTSTNYSYGTYTVPSTYTLPVTISATIPTNVTADYNLYIENSTSGNSTAHQEESSTRGPAYTFTYNPPPQYSISNVQWSQGGTNNNDVSVSWTNTNIGAIISPGIELHEVGGSNNPLQTTTTGNSFGPITITQNTNYKLVYNGADVTGSAYSATYTAPAQFNATFGTPTISNYGATWAIPVNYTNANSQTLQIRVLHADGSNTTIQPTFNVSGNGTRTYTDTYNSYNAFTLVNGDILYSNQFTNTYTISGIPSQQTYSIAGTWGFSNNTVTYTYTQSNGSTEQVEMLKPNGSSADGPNSYSGNQQTLTWVMNDATTDGTYTVTPGGGLANITSPQPYNYVAPPPPPPQQPSTSYAPAKGGRKRRFPIISTQLFNRQRSVYSIGTTHHELAPQF